MNQAYLQPEAASRSAINHEEPGRLSSPEVSLTKIRDKAGGVEHYRKLHDLFKHADPGLLEVKDTRKRLAGLRQ